jgi:hypothetical protein
MWRAAQRFLLFGTDKRFLMQGAGSKIPADEISFVNFMVSAHAAVLCPIVGPRNSLNRIQSSHVSISGRMSVDVQKCKIRDASMTLWG